MYSFEKKGEVSFSGKRIYRRGDYRITDHYQLDCEIEAEYAGLPYDASAFFGQPQQCHSAFRFKTEQDICPCLSKWFYADTNDVGKDVYQPEAEEIVMGDGRRRLTGNTVCRKYHVGEEAEVAAAEAAVDTVFKVIILPGRRK